MECRPLFFSREGSLSSELKDLRSIATCARYGRQSALPAQEGAGTAKHAVRAGADEHVEAARFTTRSRAHRAPLDERRGAPLRGRRESYVDGIVVRWLTQPAAAA